MRWPTSRSSSPGQPPSGLMQDGENEKLRRKWLAPNSGLTPLRSRCEACSTILSEGSKEHTCCASVKPNLLWKNSNRSGATSDACHCRPTRWEQWERLTTPHAVKTALKRKRQQKRQGPFCKQYENKSYPSTLQKKLLPVSLHMRKLLMVVSVSLLL
jgi:hypothetical protein